MSATLPLPHGCSNLAQQLLQGLDAGQIEVRRGHRRPYHPQRAPVAQVRRQVHRDARAVQAGHVAAQHVWDVRRLGQHRIRPGCLHHRFGTEQRRVGIARHRA